MFFCRKLSKAEHPCFFGEKCSCLFVANLVFKTIFNQKFVYLNERKITTKQRKGW